MSNIEKTDNEYYRLNLYAEAINAFKKKQIKKNTDVAQIIKKFNSTQLAIDELVNLQIREIGLLLSGEQEVKKEKSFFDEYDAENGYQEEIKKGEVWESYNNALNNILQICINSMKNSYKECQDSNLPDLLEYVQFQIKYDREVQRRD